MREAVFKRIYADLRRKITSAQLKAGDRLDTESKLAEVYGKMRGVTEFFSARIEEAGRERDKVYGKKQVVRAHLNAARTVIRARMSDID